MLRNYETSGIDVITEYSVGDVINHYKGYPDITQFDLHQGHSILYVLLEKPTIEELRQLKYHKVDIRMTCLPDVLWLTFKFGNLPYMDAPFTPHLAHNVRFPADLKEACDILQVVIVDTSSGSVVGVRAIKFSDDFSAALRVGCMCLLPQEFNQAVYDILLENTKAKYTAQQIADAAIVTFMAERRNECNVVKKES